MTRLVIHVYGGRVDSIYTDADTPLRVEVVDEDNLKHHGLDLEERDDLLKETIEDLTGIDFDHITPPQFLNHYCHEDCPKQPGVEWEDTWSATSNDECPACGATDIEPYESEQLS